MTVLEQELRAGLPGFEGARVRATVPVRQDVLDLLLERTDFRVDIHERNQITIRYGMVQVKAEIVRVTPELTLVLKLSWFSRTALRGAMAWKPGLHVYLDQRDEFVYILCGRIPAVAKYKNIWQHLSGIDARTVPGKLVFDAELRVGARR